MPERSYKLFVTDIRDCTKKILDYTKDRSFEEFVNDQMLIDAVVRNLEIIGEASKNLPEKIKDKYQMVE